MVVVATGQDVLDFLAESHDVKLIGRKSRDRCGGLRCVRCLGGARCWSLCVGRLDLLFVLLFLMAWSGNKLEFNMPDRCLLCCLIRTYPAADLIDRDKT